MADSAHR
ncbi:hypothetical protein YPPY89_2284, partial [Yersinia pestis PY-89]